MRALSLATRQLGRAVFCPPRHALPSAVSARARSRSRSAIRRVRSSRQAVRSWSCCSHSAAVAHGTFRPRRSVGVAVFAHPPTGCGVARAWRSCQDGRSRSESSSPSSNRLSPTIRALPKTIDIVGQPARSAPIRARWLRHCGVFAARRGPAHGRVRSGKRFRPITLICGHGR